MQRQICPSDALDEAHAAYSAASELDGASDEDSSRKRKLPECNICFEKTRFSDIIGHGAAKVRIEELLLPLALPPAVANAVLTGVRALPASLLLHGPPGCGKTKLARAIAGEAQAAFLNVAPSDILSKYVGESEGAMRELFDEAWDQASKLESKCAVVFFDEIDALGQARSSSGNGDQGESCSRRVLAELLLQLNLVMERNRACSRSDSREDHSIASENAAYGERIIVVAATNRPEDCDPALLRRFGIRVFVGLPSAKDRKKMICRLLEGIEHSITPSEFKTLAHLSNGWSGSDVENLTREASMAPVRECIRDAALLRKRHAKQSGGVASGQVEGDEQLADPQLVARNHLLQGFKTLRPVSLRDFENAAIFLLGPEESDHCLAMLSPTAVSRTQYDSSSDEDE